MLGSKDPKVFSGFWLCTILGTRVKKKTEKASHFPVEALNSAYWKSCIGDSAQEAEWAMGDQRTAEAYQVRLLLVYPKGLLIEGSGQL